MGINRVMSWAAIAFAKSSIVAIAAVASSGLQVAGIGGIALGPIQSVQDAIKRGANAQEIAELGRAQGFDVSIS